MRRAYHTVYGIWTYFTADDGQVNLADSDYLGIGTLESFKKMRKYYGEDAVCPVYVQVEDGERLSRALNTRESRKIQDMRKCAEDLLQISRIFQRKIF